MNSRSVRKMCGKLAVWFGVCFGLTAGATLVGCEGAERVARLTLASTFHGKHGWRAEDFFTDPLVIELCRAFVANDLEEIDRLVAGLKQTVQRLRDGVPKTTLRDLKLEITPRIIIDTIDGELPAYRGNLSVTLDLRVYELLDFDEFKLPEEY